MKVLRFEAEAKIFAGRLEGDRIFPLGSDTFPREFKLNEVRVLPPCVPSKVVAVGLNYRDHADELNLQLPQEPLLFMKPASSVIAHGDPIILPSQSSRVDFEAELAVVIGKTAKHVSRDNAADHIIGYTCLNDVTARDLQNKDGQWTRSKSFDTFCPIGPWIETEIDPADLLIELHLIGVTRLKSRTSNLIFSPAVLVEFISGVMTLFPGDVIATGTTSGIGPMKAGDIVEVHIEGIGLLINPVVNRNVS
ncbi:MAG: fumarylacetoacetate hydrolase family protein [Desulfomonile tiedjei]|uniref:Fumarylacetoacetate hydrolase family protein n=1 Tax=Desulfomonile tiedjei TaxID=2358 RepID=A0A9D6V485_9BACT|nr:fumarylacetoacetate hydrolase family protein [Desulfomonile tiedjei]